MFTAGDSSIEIEKLKKVIFEWCKSNNGIIDIELSRNEGFLFIKCKDKPSPNPTSSPNPTPSPKPSPAPKPSPDPLSAATNAYLIYSLIAVIIVFTNFILKA